jgi:hypothetical protein
MKILQNEITGTPIGFSINFGGKLSFILSFLSPERLPLLLLHIFSLLLPVQYYNYSWTLCIKCWDIIKSPYFVDTTEIGDRGWEQALRQAEDFTDKL